MDIEESRLFLGSSQEILKPEEVHPAFTSVTMSNVGRNHASSSFRLGFMPVGLNSPSDVIRLQLSASSMVWLLDSVADFAVRQAGWKPPTGLLHSDPVVQFLRDVASGSKLIAWQERERG